MMIGSFSTNISRHLPKQWHFTNRCVSTNVSLSNQTPKHAVEEERWSRFYTLQEMKYLAINTRLKFYPALLTCLGTPIGFMVDQAAILPDSHFFPGVLYIGKL